LITGKDIILLLGSTGSGKSTTIHYLCGSKMDKRIENGKLQIYPSKVRNEKLR